MKRLFKATAAGIFFCASAGFMLAGCTGSEGCSADVTLNNGEDSLAYAASMLISERMPGMMAQEGIDSTTVDDFIRGMRTAFPTEDTPESRAFISGVFAAIEAAEMLESIDASIYPDEKGKKADRRIFLEGLVATASGDNSIMDCATATNYYNQRIFRARSEQFMADNRKRPGVVTLNSGVQYKIEHMGNGAKATRSGSATCIYKGTYPNGAVFATSRGEAVEMTISELTPGLAEVLMALPAGTRCKAYIPWEQAYGEKGKGNIAPYSALVYDLEIVSAR